MPRCLATLRLGRAGRSWQEMRERPPGLFVHGNSYENRFRILGPTYFQGIEHTPEQSKTLFLCTSLYRRIANNTRSDQKNSHRALSTECSPKGNLLNAKKMAPDAVTGPSSLKVKSIHVTD